MKTPTHTRNLKVPVLSQTGHIIAGPRAFRRPTWGLLTPLFMLAAALLVAIAMTAPGVGAAAQPSASTELLLKASDLPAGFTASPRRTIVAAQAAQGAQIALATLQHEKWLSGDEAAYQRAASSGPALVDVTVNVFAQSSGAHWYFLHATGQAHHSSSSNNAARQIVVKKVGDESAAWTLMRGSMTGITVLFRQGRYVADLVTAGSAGAITTDQVIALAQMQDHYLAGTH